VASSGSPTPPVTCRSLGWLLAACSPRRRRSISCCRRSSPVNTSTSAASPRSGRAACSTRRWVLSSRRTRWS
ncbi:MAG: hypothetical protein AVDCRST_MAG18-115, partial [uncultured Thermomicrobiales bacterium]